MTDNQDEIFTNHQANGIIRHIVCICCDRADINEWKPRLQSMIIDAEIKAGSTLTPTSRISFDSLVDYSSLQNDWSLKMKLMQVFMSTYGAAEAEADALSSVYKGDSKQEDGKSILAKFFVLYEQQAAAFVPLAGPTAPLTLPTPKTERSIAKVIFLVLAAIFLLRIINELVSLIVKAS